MNFADGDGEGRKRKKLSGDGTDELHGAAKANSGNGTKVSVLTRQLGAEKNGPGRFLNPLSDQNAKRCVQGRTTSGIY